MASSNLTRTVITTTCIPSELSSPPKMMFQIKLTVMALAVVFLFAGEANGIAPNPVDACNGSNDYSEGHSCAFQESQGICRTNNCGVLVCVPN
ncbi:hypothetical protein DFS33DRAFT_1379002 [Desarmillaria ectypa]|nr:hypothetical protein DFS33DRAFT_1379002 [Desarmillaria ectypa]